MIRKILLPVLLFISAALSAQTPNSQSLQRPKLVVGIVVDQMRWDYLTKFYPLFSANGGFKRLMNKGFSCDNTMIPYVPTVTAAGHSCIYTGSVPAINGMVGNDWFDNLTNKQVYCTDDDSVTTVGAADNAGKMSPKNLLATTIGDELRMATNFSSKVIGISIKDRAAILPAGHGANAAYWYDGGTGNFITSSYYMNELPLYIQNFNRRALTDSFYNKDWSLSLPSNVYQQYCGNDVETYEATPLGASQKQFPYSLKSFIQKDYSRIASTPYGNSLLASLAKTVVLNEHLGKDTATDFLAISFSSPDYIGHAFGPNSWEQLDDYIKLDSVLGNFFSFLDEQVGTNNYTVFLTADHGVANSPGFAMQHHLPGGVFRQNLFINTLNQLLSITYNSANIVKGIDEYQILLNHSLIDSLKLNLQSITETIVDFAQHRPEIAQAFATNNINNAPLTIKQKEMFQNGYFPQRSGDIDLVLKPGYVDGTGIGTTHGVWNPYDAHIPLLWYGWGIKQGNSNREVYMTDIAPTLCSMLHIEMPSGSVGKVINEVLK